jgi:hypothetical protein
VITTLVGVVGIALGIAVGMWVGSWHGKYRDPHLHEGGPYTVAVDKPWGRIWHREGVPWHEAPKPPTRHRCSAHTCLVTKTLVHEDRCACGAVRYGVYGRWQGVNARWNRSSVVS